MPSSEGEDNNCLQLGCQHRRGDQAGTLQWYGRPEVELEEYMKKSIAVKEELRAKSTLPFHSSSCRGDDREWGVRTAPLFSLCDYDSRGAATNCAGENSNTCKTPGVQRLFICSLFNANIHNENIVTPVRSRRHKYIHNYTGTSHYWGNKKPKHTQN